MSQAPRETSLYRKIAKDYQPKQADMQICKYIEGLEARIVALEAAKARTMATPEITEGSTEPAKVRKSKPIAESEG